MTRVLDRWVFFTWWSQLNARFESLSPVVRRSVIISAIILGVALRIWAQTKPGNYDFDSWLIGSTRALDGEDPYSTSRYNYAPPWLLILTALQALTGEREGFRLGITLVLTAVDLGIAATLIARRYPLPAVLFLIVPIGIAISGQHQQFDNIAVLLALLAMMVAAGIRSERVCRSDYAVVALLGLSISVKHIFLVFPLWLFMTAKTWPRRLLYLFAPLVIFGLVLLPAYIYSPTYVMKYVINYQGANNSPVLYFLAPDQLVPWLIDHSGAKVLFVLLLILAGWLFRKTPPYELALVYTISTVLFSWAVVNQYLAIPLAGVLVFLNIGFLVWLGLVTIYLGGDPTVLDIPVLNQIQPHTLLEYNVVAQDLFPWLLLGWILLYVCRMRSRADSTGTDP